MTDEQITAIAREYATLSAGIDAVWNYWNKIHHQIRKDK